MYDVQSDPYCYPGTTVLKNRAGIKTQSKLEAFEHDAASQRGSEPLPAGRLSVSHYRHIDRMNPKAMMAAMIESFGGGEGPLTDLIAQLIE